MNKRSLQVSSGVALIRKPYTSGNDDTKQVSEHAVALVVDYSSDFNYKKYSHACEYKQKTHLDLSPSVSVARGCDALSRWSAIVSSKKLTPNHFNIQMRPGTRWIVRSNQMPLGGNCNPKTSHERKNAFCLAIIVSGVPQDEPVWEL